jgi:CBS domain containing-hemolysin-like protein
MDNLIYSDILKLIAVALLVMANALFVAAEFSLVSVRKTRISELVSRGNLAAKAVEKAINNPDKVIATTQLGITLSSLGLGWLGEPALAHLILPVVQLFPAQLQEGVSHAISAAIAFILITFLHVVIGELTPKSIALQDPEKTSLFVARPTLWTEALFKPAIWALNGTGNALLRLVGVKPASGHELVHSVEELRMIVTASTEGGAVEADESEMLQAVFDFRDMIVRQVMVPRTEIVAVEADMPLNEIITLTSTSTYTKFPVYDDSLDQILGIVHVKDLLVAMQDAECHDCTARRFTRDAIFVPETISVRSLLSQFRDNRLHIAIVLDEFGGTAGLVTLEDLLEELVGEVSDPFDAADPAFQVQPDGSYSIDGLTLIEEVNHRLNLNLEDPDYDTIAGFTLGKLEHIPKKDEVVEYGGILFRIEEMDGLRIARISIRKLETGRDGSPERDSSPGRDTGQEQVTPSEQTVSPPRTSSELPQVNIPAQPGTDSNAELRL